MKKIIPVSIFLISFSIFSQKLEFAPPKYESIETEIKNQKSKFYYPILLDKLITNDSTLTVEDYYYLYYGFVFQKEYKPYARNTVEEKLTKYFQKPEIDSKDYDIIIQIISESINLLPFDLRQLNMLAYVYHLKGDEIMAKKISTRFHRILETILASGDGEKCETGFHVIYIQDEYILLNFFQMRPISQSLIGNCDYQSFEKGKYKKEGIYFNIQKMFESGIR